MIRSGVRCSTERDSRVDIPQFHVEDFGRDGPSMSVQKVLVVDDNRDLADMAEQLLRIHGFEVLVAYSAAEALALLETETSVDGLFTDIVMPEMSGLELASIVEKKHPMIKIVLTSGYTSPALSTSYQKPKLFLHKPYSIDDLVKMLLT